MSFRINLFFLLFIGFFISLNGQSNSYQITRSTTLIDGTGVYSPGDTIYLEAGLGDYYLFRNIHGSAENPIVIINQGGQVEILTPHFYGIKFDNCSYIKLSGTGDESHLYGVYISYVDKGTGISIDNKSTDIEIENVEISNTPIGGIYAKTEPFMGDCENLTTRDNFTMYNIKIHDCYLHEIHDEGFYVGSSKYTGQTIIADPETYPCNGEVVLPHVIEGVEIYNNIIENTGWDGIQVSSAVSNCFIYGNTIRNDSYRETQNQMSGILIGGGSNCDCYNNKIFDGKGDGIDILGLGNHKIYNNLIVRPGKTYHPNDDPTSFQKHGIWTGSVATETNTEILIYNNTIISPRTFGLRLSNPQISAYKIFNNIIVDPGSHSVLGDNSYMNITDGVSYFLLNNLLRANVSEIQFQNPTANNFDIGISSPAYNTGVDLSSLNLTTDIDGRPRPFAGIYDIGAYENQESINAIDEILISEKNKNLIKIMPNPVKESAVIEYKLSATSPIKLYVMDRTGRMIDLLVNEKQLKNTYQINIFKAGYEAGIYFLVMETKKGRFTKKLIFI